MRHPATSDRNFYDRYYFNCHECSGDLMLLAGIGQYPNLGVTDGFALIRHGDRHQVEGAVPAHLEPRHFIRWQERAVFDSLRLSQTGTWRGHITTGDRVIAVSPDRWWGARDRSRGVRPVGEPEPPGIQAKNPAQFYWMYAPMQFSD